MIFLLFTLFGLVNIYFPSFLNYIYGFAILASSLFLIRYEAYIYKLLLSSILGKILVSILIVSLIRGVFFCADFSTPHFLLDLISILALPLGASVFLRSYQTSGIEGVFTEIVLANLGSVLVVSIAILSGGFGFSSIDTGRAYMNQADVSLSSLCQIAVFSFPFFFLSKTLVHKLLIFASFSLFSVTALASGGRSFFLFASYVLLVLVVFAWPRMIKARLGFSMLPFVGFVPFLVYFLRDSLQYVYLRSFDNVLKSRAELESGMDARLYETLYYIQSNSPITILLGKGIGSTTHSVLFDEITSTLHFSPGTLILKIGVIGLFSLSLWVVSFVWCRNVLFRRQLFVASLPLIGWFISIEIAHTSLTEPQSMFYLGYFLCLYHCLSVDLSQRVTPRACLVNVY